MYSVSKSSLQRWINQSNTPKRKTRKQKDLIGSIKNCIESALFSNPCMTLQQICTAVSKDCGVHRSSASTASKWLRKMDYSRKKVYNTIAYTPPDELVNGFTQTYSSLADSDIICIDEAGFHVGDHGRYGYSKRGRRIHVESSRTLRKKRYTLIMAIGPSGVVHYQILEGGCKKPDFIQFIRDMPTDVTIGKTIVMDNVRFHHSTKTLDEIRNKGSSPLFIPPYSPRYNAIEYAFGLLKRTYRSICNDADRRYTPNDDDYMHALTISIGLLGSFETLFGKVRHSVDAFREGGAFERYD